MVRQLFFRSGVYFSGLVLVKVLSTFVFIFLARLLQPELFGKLSFFLTLLSLLTLVSDWGLIQWFQVNRTVANEVAQIKRVSHARLFAAIASMGIFILYNLVFHVFTPVETALFVFAIFPEAFLSVCDGYYLVRHRSPMIAVKQLSKYLAPVLIILIYQHHVSLLSVMCSFLISSLLTCLWYVPSSYYPNFKVSRSQIFSTLSESSAYASLILTSAVYSRGDALILQNTLGNAAVGIYSAGYRYLDALSLFPGALAQNLFHLSTQKGTMTRSRVVTLTGVMTGFGLLFGVLLFLCSHFLTVGLLGQNYAQTEIVVKVFSAVTVVMFINSPLSTIVQSSTLVKKFLPWGVLNTTINICLNLVLIPIAGGVGAASVMLITECTGLLINVYFVRQTLKIA